MTTFTTRAYNKIVLNENKGVIEKFSKETRLADEIEHYKNLPKDVKVWFPRYFDSGYKQETKEYFLQLEFYAYSNLGVFLTENKETPSKDNKNNWQKIACLISNALSSFAAHTKTDDITNDSKRMYEEKTMREYENLVNNFDADGLPYNSKRVPELQLNGKIYKNFLNIWIENENYFKEILYDDIRYSFFHGDLCFSNILYGNIGNSFTIKLLDPRGKFGTKVAYGDQYYDLAKLIHSTDVGYEYFIYDKFNVDVLDSSKYKLSYQNNHKDMVNKIFNETLYSLFNIQKIKLIQGLIYIGMCARHYDSKQRQLAMYLSGVRVLNEVVAGRAL